MGAVPGNPQYPDEITLGTRALSCTYRFESGQERDWITVRIPQETAGEDWDHRKNVLGKPGIQGMIIDFTLCSYGFGDVINNLEVSG